MGAGFSVPDEKMCTATATTVCRGMASLSQRLSACAMRQADRRSRSSAPALQSVTYPPVCRKGAETAQDSTEYSRRRVCG